MTLLSPSYRVAGEVIVSRNSNDNVSAGEAHALIEALPADGPPIQIWSQILKLLPVEDERIVAYEAGGGGMPLRFTIALRDTGSGQFTVGWSAPHIRHAFEPDDTPGRLRALSLPFFEIEEEAMAALLPSSWRPKRAVAWGGRFTGEGLVLSPGGELWVRAEGVVSAFAGVAKPFGGDAGLASPVVRACYYKGGRLELTSQEGLSAEGEIPFKIWSAEPDGWLVLSVDDTLNAPPVLVKVTLVEAPH